MRKARRSHIGLLVNEHHGAVHVLDLGCPEDREGLQRGLGGDADEDTVAVPRPRPDHPGAHCLGGVVQRGRVPPDRSEHDFLVTSEGNNTISLKGSNGKLVSSAGDYLTCNTI